MPEPVRWFFNTLSVVWELVLILAPALIIWLAYRLLQLERRVREMERSDE